MTNKYLQYLGLAALAVCGAACAQQAAPALRTLKIQGDEYASACAPKNIAALQATLKEEAGKAAAVGDAWPLINTLLCEKKAAGNAYVADHIEKTVIDKSASSGSPDSSGKTKVDAALIDSLLSEGEAWNAHLWVAKNEIVLKFMPDEACVRSRTLRLSKGKWRIVQLGEACD